jgi:hypothetical protein
MGMSDYLGWIHGKDDRSSGALVPVTIVNSAGTIVYTEDQLDFGAAVSGAPCEIASLFPNIASGAIRIGLHMVITLAFNVLSVASVGINTSATNALTTGTVLTTRTFTLAQLIVLGAHYFIPLPPGPANILRYLAAYVTPTGTATTGSVEMWFGPDADGAI